MGWFVSSKNLHVEVLTPSTLVCDAICILNIYKLNEVIRVDLNLI